MLSTNEVSAWRTVCWLELWYKLRIRESEKLKTVLELYFVETHQKKLGPDYYRLKTVVKRSIEQEIRNKNFGARIGNFERNAVVKNQGTKQREQRILGDCWQWEANGQCSKGDNSSFRHGMNKRAKSTQPNPSPRSPTQQHERNASRTRSPEEKGIFSYTPEPHVAFCPIFVHPLFPAFELHIQKWVIFVRRRPLTFQNVRQHYCSCLCQSVASRDGDESTNAHLRRQLNFPNVKNDAGQKQYSSCFLRRHRRPKAGDAFTRTRLMPTFGVSVGLSVERCRP